MGSPRFVVVSPVDARLCANADGWLIGDDDFFPNYLVDTASNEIVFCDEMEPEDRSLRRDLSQLVELLNSVAQESAATADKEPGESFAAEWDRLAPARQTAAQVIGHRADRNLSQQQLAERAMLTPSEVELLESGEETVPPSVMERWNSYLGRWA